MRDYPIIDTHTHTFPTREVGRQAIQALPLPGASGIVEDLLPELAAAGFARAIMLNFFTGSRPARWPATGTSSPWCGTGASVPSG